MSSNDFDYGGGLIIKRRETLSTPNGYRDFLVIDGHKIDLGGQAGFALIDWLDSKGHQPL